NRSFPPELEVCPHDGARLIQITLPAEDLSGRTLDDRYIIDEPLGAGGMGVVYRGRQLSVDREVAIKVIHFEHAGTRDTVKRFLPEARLTSRLSHPSIVNVFDFGQTPGGLYLVMELLRGHTLSAELERGAMPIDRAVRIATQLCDALEAAHARDIVHRDLKPGNVVVLDGDAIKVLDFGLAKSLEVQASAQITRRDAIVGTPLYMSPEQIDGRPCAPRSDLYSLGCMLYEMLAGSPPFRAGSASAVLAKHLGEPPPPLPPA